MQKNNLKILIATPLYAPQIGGPATYVKILEKMLPENNISVAVIPFNKVSRWPRLIKHILFGFYVYREGKKVDIIYALDPISVGIPSAIASYLLNKRFFVRIAGDYAWEQYSGLYGTKESPLYFAKRYKEYPFKIRIFKEIQTEVAKHAEKIIAPSNYIKKVISEWGILNKKIVIINNTPEPSIVEKNKKTLRGLLNFNGKLLISAGRLIPLKCFDELIDITPVLKKTYPNLKFLIIGDGPEKRSLEKRIEKLNLEDTVILTGALQQDVLFGYIRASDAFVINSLHETFSHHIIESMSLGVPVIATDVGGNPEIIEHNKSGVLVKHGDKKELVNAIKKMFNDTSFRVKIIHGAKERLKMFRREHIIAQIKKELQ